MPMNSSVKTIAIIARNELADSVRSRRVIVMVILYLIGAAAATALFIQFLHSVETEALHAIGVSASKTAGGATTALWKSDSFRRTKTE